MSTVETANALGSPFDAVNGATGTGGERIPTWPVIGRIDSAVRIERGRMPQTGEALVSTMVLDRLGLAQPAGFLATPDGLVQYPIVGSFSPKAPFEDLQAGALVPASADTVGRELRVVVDNIASASSTVSAIISTLSPPDPMEVRIESPTAIAETARDLNAQMTGYGRQLLLLILGVGGFFVAAVVLADVLIRRRDLGRRRTLGITRSDLATVVTSRTLAVAILGATIGCIAGWAVNNNIGSPTPAAFTAAVGVLAALGATMASIPQPSTLLVLTQSAS